MAEIRQQSIVERAQRLWVLERNPHIAAPSGRADVFRFLNAIAVVDDAVVRVGFVRSCDAHRSTDGCLETPRVWLDINRNAAGFPTLDAAMAWAESRKLVLLRQGWTELDQQDSCEL